VQDCDWVGGPGHCTFEPEQSVTLEECRDKCEEDPNCRFYASHTDTICNLFMMDECHPEPWVGDVFADVTPKPLNLVAGGATCRGCRKDLSAGQYVYCDGFFTASTVKDCDWVGGAGRCTFEPETAVTLEECQAKCDEDPACHYFASAFNSVCNLIMMTECRTEVWAGDVYME